MNFIKRTIFLLLAILISGLAAETNAQEKISPLRGLIEFVAGGSRDSSAEHFYNTSFEMPAGLALDEQRKILYVTDKELNRIIAVNLNEGNSVATVAKLNAPTSIVFFPDNTLVFLSYDKEKNNSFLYKINLADKQISPIIPKAKEDKQALFSGVSDLLALPNSNLLLWTNPEHGEIGLIDKETGEQKSLVKDSPDIPRPYSLTLYNNLVYILDQRSKRVYRLKEIPSLAAESKVMYEQAGDAPNAQRIRGSKNGLYFVLEGLNSINKGFPYEPLKLFNAWGERMPATNNPDTQEKNYESILFDALEGQEKGFLVSQNDPAQIFVTDRINKRVISIRDYDVDKNILLKSEKGVSLSDIRYPKEKDPAVTRILMVSDSGAFYQGEEITKRAPMNKLKTLGKRLEQDLNLRAHLHNSAKQFELLNMAEVSWHQLFVWPFFRVPKVVKDYSVDLVILPLFRAPFIETLFNAPIPQDNSENEEDPEFAIMPDTQKRDFQPLVNLVQACEAHKMVEVGTNGKYRFRPIEELCKFEDVKQSIKELYGALALKIKNKIFQNLPAPPSLVLSYTPIDAASNNDCVRDLYRGIAAQGGFNYLDLSDYMMSILTTYYTSNGILGYHLTEDGHALYARVLEERLFSSGILKE
jgi:hypothetical protein